MPTDAQTPRPDRPTTAAVTADEMRVVDGILARLQSPGGYDGFESQLRAVRGCRRPIRLSGRAIRMDRDGLHPRISFDTRGLPGRSAAQGVWDET